MAPIVLSYSGSVGRVVKMQRRIFEIKGPSENFKKIEGPLFLIYSIIFSIGGVVDLQKVKYFSKNIKYWSWETHVHWIELNWIYCLKHMEDPKNEISKCHMYRGGSVVLIQSKYIAP